MLSLLSSFCCGDAARRGCLFPLDRLASSSSAIFLTSRPSTCGSRSPNGHNSTVGVPPLTVGFSSPRVPGDVFHLNALGTHIIVLNSREAINELFVKRGANYSDRPVLTMCNMYAAVILDLPVMQFSHRLRVGSSGWDNVTPLWQYHDPRLRAARKMSAQVLNTHAVDRYSPILEHSVRLFLQKMASSPEAVEEHSHWYAHHRVFASRVCNARYRLAASIIMKVVYDHDIAFEGVDPLVEGINTTIQNFNLASSPGWVVDMFPARTSKRLSPVSRLLFLLQYASFLSGFPARASCDKHASGRNRRTDATGRLGIL